MSALQMIHLCDSMCMVLSMFFSSIFMPIVVKTRPNKTRMICLNIKIDEIELKRGEIAKYDN